MTWLQTQLPSDCHCARPSCENHPGFTVNIWTVLMWSYSEYLFSNWWCCLVKRGTFWRWGVTKGIGSLRCPLVGYLPLSDSLFMLCFLLCWGRRCPCYTLCLLGTLTCIPYYDTLKPSKTLSGAFSLKSRPINQENGIKQHTSFYDKLENQWSQLQN